MPIQLTSSALRTVFDTSDLSETHRVSLWHDVGSKLYVTHQPRVLKPSQFWAVTEFATSHHYDVSIVRMENVELERTYYHSKNDDCGRCFICMLLCGSISFIQDDKINNPAPGQIFVIDSTRPYKIIYLVRSYLLHLTLPRDELERRIGNTMYYSGITTDLSDPIGVISSEMMQKVVATLEFTGEPAELRILETCIDLATLALSRAVNATRGNTSSNSDAVLARLEHSIKRQLTRADLDATTLANDAGVSVRYANKLLCEHRRTSLMRYVLDLRLNECSRIFIDPSQGFRSITDIALSLGFNDLSHFSRTFKKRYGMSAKEYRAKNKIASEHIG